MLLITTFSSLKSGNRSIEEELVKRRRNVESSPWLGKGEVIRHEEHLVALTANTELVRRLPAEDAPSPALSLTARSTDEELDGCYQINQRELDLATDRSAQ
jgi:hypothetical protein